MSRVEMTCLQEQVELHNRKHTETEKFIARPRCREFFEGGWGSIDWSELLGVVDLRANDRPIK